jgi:hypothetical protein
MAGGIAGKAQPLFNVALAKLKAAEDAIQQLNQVGGALSTDPRITATDTAIAAAITAITALT